ncbi:MAG: preprotein translocase subunit YajC [Deltaproteobacteria bacterium]|nr:preprotein translocase subunit YajC [Deltaproteobacteria bacterium]
MFSDLAHAMGTQPGQGGGGGGLEAFIPIILMFVIFYFLLIRPQQKKAKDHQEMINNLKKGDPVITNGGIIGVITNLNERIATIEVADKVKIKVTRGSIADLNRPAPPQGAKK